MKKFYIVIVLVIIGSTVFAQKGWNQQFKKKGKFYGYWGYNLSGYTHSDISFKGQDYNFTIYEVDAADRPTEFDWGVYFNPGTISIPQWNLRFGYYITDRWTLSIGTDHMKYVMPQGQMVAIQGYINVPGDLHNGTYNREPIELEDSFLRFEHTDGLNYAGIETEYHGNIYQFNEKYSINYYAGPGIGILIPRSNVTLLNYPRYDEFHIAGFGVSGKVGVETILFKYLTLNAEWKNGYINMPDILTTGDNPTDRASQAFWFTEFTWTIGFIIGGNKE